MKKVTGTSKAAYEKIHPKITQLQQRRIMMLFTIRPNWTRAEIAGHFRERHKETGKKEDMALSEKSTISPRVRELLDAKRLAVLLEKRKCKIGGGLVGQLVCTGNPPKAQQNLF